MSANPRLDQHLDLCAAKAPGWIAPVLQAAQDRLARTSTPELQGLPRAGLNEASQVLRLSAPVLASAFQRELARQLHADLVPRGSSAAPKPKLGELALVDDDAAAEKVEVLRTIQQIEGGCEWELRELQARTATLRGQRSVEARSNPLRPEVFTRALAGAATESGLSAAGRRALLRAASEALLPAMQRACQEANAWLAQWNVEPAKWKVDSVASARLPGPGSSGFDVTRPGALDELRSARRGPRSPQTPRLDPAALLTLLLERMGQDPRLAPPIQRRIVRLAPLAQRALAADARLLDDHGHALWRALNRLATHTLGYEASDDARLRAFLQTADPWIVALANEAAPSVARLNDADAALAALCAQHLRTEQQALGPVIERLRRAEQAEVLAQGFRAKVRAEVDTAAAAVLSPTLRQFLLGAWCEAMAQLAAREGAAAPALERMAALPAELITSLQVPRTPLARRDLVAQLPTLAKTLNEGLALSSLAPAERQAIGDELLARHTELLRPAAAATPDTPEAIVRRMLDEETPAAQALAGASSVIDESQLDTLPAQLADARPETPPMRWLDGAQAGLWCHAFLDDGWRAARLMWISPQRTHWLWAGDARHHSLTGRAVERLAQEGLLVPLEQRNLLERAVDALLTEPR